LKVMTARGARNHIGEFLDASRREPVLITRNDRSVGIMVSIEDAADTLTAEAVHSRIVAEIEASRVFPERIRASTRIPGARDPVVRGLPYVAFAKVPGDVLIVLNVVHTAREFPARRGYQPPGIAQGIAALPRG